MRKSDVYAFLWNAGWTGLAVFTILRLRLDVAPALVLIGLAICTWVWPDDKRI